MLEAKVIFFTDNESYNWFEQFLKTWVFYHSLWLVEVEETPPQKKTPHPKTPQIHQQQQKMWRRERRQKE